MSVTLTKVADIIDGAWKNYLVDRFIAIYIFRLKIAFTTVASQVRTMGSKGCVEAAPPAKGGTPAPRPDPNSYGLQI